MHRQSQSLLIAAAATALLLTLNGLLPVASSTPGHLASTVDGVMTMTPTATSTATITLTPTPTATPTSFHLFDLYAVIDDDTDPVTFGQPLRYTVTLGNNGPATAYQAYLAVETEEQLSLVEGRPPATCRTWYDELQWCYFPHPFLGSEEWTFALYYVVTGTADTFELCVSAHGSSPLPGHSRDLNPYNNSDCEETTIVVPFQSFLSLLLSQ